MKREVNSYTDDFKMEVARDYLMSDLSFSRIQQKYGIKSRTSVSDWIRRFGLQLRIGDERELKEEMKKENQMSSREQELELKIKKLEKELERERLRTLALNTMIDIAERDLKIKVRKNSGAKQ